ncbi:MAG: NusG domain II-containing protein [Tissierellia bacterium]|nr:NusG domain II-containing protein [Tissierellia bacterium]
MNTKLKLGDFIIILVIIFASVGILFVSKSNLNKVDAGNKYASIQVNGVEIDRIMINESTDGMTYPVNSEFGYNLLEFSKDGVRSIEATCPDQIDVKQGFIYNSGETIVCLPNRMVVEIITEVDVDDVDVVN